MNEPKATTPFSPWELPPALVAQVRAFAQRYAGWYADFAGSWPCEADDVNVIISGAVDIWRRLLMQAPSHYDHAGVADADRLRAFCSAMADEQDFPAWCAIDAATKEKWDPLAQSYQDFCASHPQAQPYLALFQAPDWPHRLCVHFSSGAASQ